MNTTTVRAVAISFALLAAGAANASVSFIGYGKALPQGEVLLTDSATLSAPNVAGSIFTGSQFNVSAAPAFSATAVDTSPYISVRSGQSLAFALSSVQNVSVYVGSLDMYNTIAFGGAGAATYTGGQLGAISGAANGDQHASATNGRFTFNFSAPVTSITLSSTGNSLEVANIAVTPVSLPSSVPEPASWAMMLVGFGGLGVAMRSRRRLAFVKA